MTLNKLRTKLDFKQHRSTLAIVFIVSMLVILPTASGLGAALNGGDERITKAPLIINNVENVVPDRYIVVLKDGIANSRIRSLIEHFITNYNADVYQSYFSALQGFAATLTPPAMEALRSHPDVVYIEAEQVLSFSGEQVLSYSGEQYDPPWGLDRIDQRDRLLDDLFSFSSTGAGVNIYILDTGIRTTHEEFGGRAFNAYSNVIDDHGFYDCNGHGTHVAGIIGGKIYGVAKSANLYNVRVINCDGTALISQVISGIDWVTANHVKPAVANLSLGGERSESLDQAVRNSIAAGVLYTIASGNGGEDACQVSPARVPAALTVGAVDCKDQVSSYSNVGTCLDLFAPGTDIISAWKSSDSALMMQSGTSMASPFAAGVAALYLEDFPYASPAEVTKAILDVATQDRISLTDDGSPNLLLYSNLQGDPEPIPIQTLPPEKPSEQAPTATPTETPTKVVQTFEDVPPDHWAYPYIETAYQEGYVEGCSSDPVAYCPDDPLSRAEISVFVDRGTHGPDFVPTWTETQIFGDVFTQDWFYEWVNVLWEDGNTSGCRLDERVFCPLQYHTRGEGSVFFLRLMHGSDFVPPEPEGLFADAPIGEWYTPWVEAAYRDGLLELCGTEHGMKICPLDLMDRGRAAYMLVQALQLPLP
jgi:subtilisin family serine protease